MSVGSVNSSNAAVRQQPVQKSSAKRTAAYAAAGLGTAAAITGAVVYRKNISGLFATLKDMFTPFQTKVTTVAAEAGGKVKGKAKAAAQTVQEKVGEGVDALKDKAGKIKDDAAEKLQNSETAQNIKNETTGFFKKAGEIFKNCCTKTWGYAKQAYNWVKTKVGGLIDNVKTYFQEMKKEAVDKAAKAE